jgi:hypothetical protein
VLVYFYTRYTIPLNYHHSPQLPGSNLSVTANIYIKAMPSRRDHYETLSALESNTVNPTLQRNLQEDEKLYTNSIPSKKVDGKSDDTKLTQGQEATRGSANMDIGQNSKKTSSLSSPKRRDMSDRVERGVQ